MLKVWGRPDAFNVQKVLWLIDELAIAHEHIPLGGSFGGLEDPAFRAMNPHGRVPVIDENGRIVWESHSIIRYLAARHGAGTLWPEQPYDRSLAERWMDWMLASLQRDFMDLFWGYYRTPEADRDLPLIARATERCAQHYALLDRHLAEQPYLAGEAFTMADIPAGTSLYRYFGLDIERPSVPNVDAWYGRLSERPAYRSRVMLPFDHLFGRREF